MLFSSDCSGGTGRVIEPPGDARANVPQGADGGCVEVGAALARVRGHAGRGAHGRSSGPACDDHAGLPVGPLVTERGDPGPGGRSQEHRIHRSGRLGSSPTPAAGSGASLLTAIGRLKRGFPPGGGLLPAGVDSQVKGCRQPSFVGAEIPAGHPGDERLGSRRPRGCSQPSPAISGFTAASAGPFPSPGQLPACRAGRRWQARIGITMPATRMWAAARATLVAGEVAAAPAGTIRDTTVSTTVMARNVRAGRAAFLARMVARIAPRRCRPRLRSRSWRR